MTVVELSCVYLARRVVSSKTLSSKLTLLLSARAGGTLSSGAAGLTRSASAKPHGSSPRETSPPPSSRPESTAGNSTARMLALPRAPSLLATALLGGHSPPVGDMFDLDAGWHANFKGSRHEAFKGSQPRDEAWILTRASGGSTCSLSQTRASGCMR